MFAVIDFETTGFIPERADRVVEVGVVLTDEHGDPQEEWTTLINPRRDIGASHIHGITGADLLDAPEFGDIADHLIALLAGRTVVAHNATSICDSYTPNSGASVSRSPRGHLHSAQ